MVSELGLMNVLPACLSILESVEVAGGTGVGRKLQSRSSVEYSPTAFNTGGWREGELYVLFKVEMEKIKINKNYKDMRNVFLVFRAHLFCFLFVFVLGFSRQGFSV